MGKYSVMMPCCRSFRTPDSSVACGQACAVPRAASNAAALSRAAGGGIPSAGQSSAAKPEASCPRPFPQLQNFPGYENRLAFVWGVRWHKATAGRPGEELNAPGGR